jgi:hypothetical protein
MKRSTRSSPAADRSAFQRALERGDDLVQTLTVAKYALCAGDVERAMVALDTALATSRAALTEMTTALSDQPMLAATLVRTAPALARAVDSSPPAPGTAASG